MDLWFCVWYRWELSPSWPTDTLRTRCDKLVPAAGRWSCRALAAKSVVEGALADVLCPLIVYLVVQACTVDRPAEAISTISPPRTGNVGSIPTTCF